MPRIGDPGFLRKLQRLIASRDPIDLPDVVEQGLFLAITIPASEVLQAASGPPRFSWSDDESSAVAIVSLATNPGAGATVSTRDSILLSIQPTGLQRARLVKITGTTEWVAGAGDALVVVMLHFSAMGAAWNDNVGGAIYRKAGFIVDPIVTPASLGVFNHDLTFNPPLLVAGTFTLFASALAINRDGVNSVNVTTRLYLHYVPD